jgi:uncharacterized small protein (TIGR04563 family)
MASSEKQKQSLYFPEDMLREIMVESTRLDRSLSWTVQQAWRVARAELQRFPAAATQGAPALEQARRSGEERGAVREARPSEQVLEFLKGKFEHDAAP